MLGESAGRSRRAPLRSEARRRFNDDERTGFTRLDDDPQEWPQESHTNRWRIAVVMAAITVTVVCGLVVAL